MKLAIATEGNQVSSHFGRCPEYTIVDIEENKIIKREAIENNCHQEGVNPPDYLNERKVNCIIAGGMGPKAIDLFNNHGIKVVMGISGNIDNVIEEFMKDNLKEGTSMCDGGHGEGNHDCGHHH